MSASDDALIARLKALPPDELVPMPARVLIDLFYFAKRVQELEPQVAALQSLVLLSAETAPAHN